MRLDDIKISRAIIERYSARLLNSLECDVAIAGGGPAGLTAAFYLARQKKNVVLFERKLALGGGVWGGGIMFNEIIVQEETKKILNDFGIHYTSVGDGYFSVQSVEAAAALCFKASQAGAKIFNLFSVEDVLMTEDRVNGLVINWSAVELARLHVDPITIRSQFVIDATGHAAEIAHIIQEKSDCRLNTEKGRIVGEGAMHADAGEQTIVENTREIFPGVYPAGMCCNAVFGGPRMGPIFGGMFRSGKRAAELILNRID